MFLRGQVGVTMVELKYRIKPEYALFLEKHHGGRPYGTSPQGKRRKGHNRRVYPKMVRARRRHIERIIAAGLRPSRGLFIGMPFKPEEYGLHYREPTKEEIRRLERANYTRYRKRR